MTFALLLLSQLSDIALFTMALLSGPVSIAIKLFLSEGVLGVSRVKELEHRTRSRVS